MPKNERYAWAKSEAERLVAELFVPHEHAQRVEVQLYSSRKRLGLTQFWQNNQTGERYALIKLSKEYLRRLPDDQVRDTIRHEIAHANLPTWEYHGPRWQAEAERVGATPQACAELDQELIPPARYKGTCEQCGYVFTGDVKKKYARCAAPLPDETGKRSFLNGQCQRGRITWQYQPA